MISNLALALVGLAALFLGALGLVALLQPARAGAFLLGFAATAGRHRLELGLRLVVGAAFVAAAPRMAASAVVEAAGWVLLATTAVMVFIPWRAHRAFAQRAVPVALSRLPLLGGASLAGAAAIAWSVLAGPGR